LNSVAPHRDTSSASYRLVLAAGWIGAVFSLLVCAFMIANNLAVRRADPVHAPALKRLVDELKTDPQNQELRASIRELDLLARQAFFTSQHFNRLGTLLLLGGLGVTLAAFKSLRTYHRLPPYPSADTPKEDLAANALWARKSVAAVGLFLVGFAITLALPWRSPLDDRRLSSVTTAPVGPAKPTSPATGVSASSPRFPSAEELEHQWPAFLGATGACALHGRFPPPWDLQSGTGVAWRVEIPLPGMNSPIVWGNRVFLSGADASRCAVYCYDAGSGRALWTVPVPQAGDKAPAPPKVSDDTGFAASSLATDGRHVGAIFADGTLAMLGCDGQVMWVKGLGLAESPYGYASSLLLHEDLLVVQFDRKSGSFIAGIEIVTGKLRWQIPRTFGPSWASPRLVRGETGPEILTAATPAVVAYEPKTGRELWRLECLKDAEVAVSPVVSDGLIFVAAESIALTAFDRTTRQVRWRVAEPTPGVCTPLVVRGLMFFGLTESGIVCLDAKTGAKLWETETESGVYASPIMAADTVCVVDREGHVYFFKATGEAYQSLGKATVGEATFSTPAVVGGRLFIRGAKHLFAFGV